MRPFFRVFFYTSILLAGLIGCGGGTIPPPPPPSDQSCTGIGVSGTLHDSLTNQPISQAWAVLESGVPNSIPSSIVSFSPSQTASADAGGAFQLCMPVAAVPAVLVVDALDSAGKAYPPFVAEVTATTNLGTVRMGGCSLSCGLPGQQQTSSPAVINGSVSSAPVSIAGSLLPQYSLRALDGSKATWTISIPPLSDAQMPGFHTAASACTGKDQFCSSYAFSLPSQKPVVLVKGGYQQDAGAPVYSIYASPASAAACAQSSVTASLENDGKTPLTGSPGLQLTAMDISFTGCQ